MMNTTKDLNNILFEQLERLQDDELSDEDLQKEIKRSKAVSDVATQIIKNGELRLRAAEYSKNWYGEDKAVPLLGIG